MPLPRVAVLDVNETLSDLGGLAGRLEAAGAPGDLVALWFATTLRDGFALTAAGELADFAAIGSATLAGMLHGTDGLRDSPEAVAEHIVAGMGALDLHPDVAPGLRALAGAGVRVVTLSNGTAEVAESLLERAGLRHLVEACLSSSDAGRWKPAQEAYALAVERCRVDASDVVMIAAHPWDLHGAHRMGLRTGWIVRDGRPWPAAGLVAPDRSADGLDTLAGRLVTDAG